MHFCSYVVISLQLITWSLVSLVLFYKGVTNLCLSTTLPLEGEFKNVTNVFNSTQIQPKPRGFTSGVVMLTIACFMIILGPACLIIKTMEKIHFRRTFAKLSQDDTPPKYDDVMASEMVPSYSTLFQIQPILTNNSSL